MQCRAGYNGEGEETVMGRDEASIAAPHVGEYGVEAGTGRPVWKVLGED